MLDRSSVQFACCQQIKPGQRWYCAPVMAENAKGMPAHGKVRLWKVYQVHIAEWWRPEARVGAGEKAIREPDGIHIVLGNIDEDQTLDRRHCLIGVPSHPTPEQR